MRKVCCSIVSAVVFKLLYVFFIFEFGVVGATLGAISGAVIGWSDKRRLKEGIIVGAVIGTTLSYKLITTISEYLHSDYDDDDNDEELVFLIHLVKLIAGELMKILRRDEHNVMGFNMNVKVMKNFFVKYFNVKYVVFSK